MDILPQLLVNSLITGSMYALATLGLALTYGLSKVLNFAHGHLMMLGAYFFYLYSIVLGLSLAPVIIFTCLSLMIVGWITMKVFVEPFLRFNPLLSFVTTLALASILEASVSIAFGVNVKSLQIDASYESLSFGSIYITPLQILIIIIAIILFCIVAFIVHASSLGRKIRALAQNGFAAQAIGINKSAITMGIFSFSVVAAGLAGVMIGAESNLQPTMGNMYTIKAFAIMLLGGLGNLWGAVVGSYILGLVENLSLGISFGEYSLPAGYKDAFAFVIILAVLLFKPRGLFGSRSRSV